MKIFFTIAFLLSAISTQTNAASNAPSNAEEAARRNRQVARDHRPPIISPVPITFSADILNRTLFNPNAEKSALQQFLELNIDQVSLTVPQRPDQPISILEIYRRANGSIYKVKALPHERAEVNDDYAASLTSALGNNQLLAAVVWTNARAAEYLDGIPVQKHP